MYFADVPLQVLEAGMLYGANGACKICWLLELKTPLGTIKVTSSLELDRVLHVLYGTRKAVEHRQAHRALVCNDACLKR